jgi:hypothetical protein
MGTRAAPKAAEGGEEAAEDGEGTARRIPLPISTARAASLRTVKMFWVIAAGRTPA